MTNSVLENNAVVRGLCPHDCPDTCALLTTVENGRAVKVHGNPDHKHTQGVLCTKVSRYTERTYSPDRLMHPLKRSGPKGTGQFVQVSWEEAIADIAAKLKAIAADNPEAVLPYSYAGTMGWVQSEAMASRFFNKMGASMLDRTICASAGGEGLVYTLGGKFGMKTEFFSESQLIVIWGSNSITSNVHFWRRAQDAKRNGAKLICIDPRHSETAEKCHVHLPIRPGTDAALAEECAQDVMATLWNKAQLYDPARASVATWVFTIARNRRIDIARRAKRPEPELLDWAQDDAPDQADIYEAAQETKRLTAALADLPEKQRALIQRAFYGDLSHSEIAAETGLPLGTIKSRIRLALDRLRQKMT